MIAISDTDPEKLLGRSIVQISFIGDGEIDVRFDNGTTLEITAHADSLGDAWLELDHWEAQ